MLLLLMRVWKCVYFLWATLSFPLSALVSHCKCEEVKWWDEVITLLCFLTNVFNKILLRIWSSSVMFFILVCIASVLLQILVFVLKRFLSAFQRGLFSFVIKPHYFFITDLVEPSLWIESYDSVLAGHLILYCLYSVQYSLFFFLHFGNVSGEKIERWYFFEINHPCPRKAVF